MPTARAILMTESATLRRIWSSPGSQLRITKHARKEMVNDAIIEADLRHVLSRNGVCWVEWKTDELWHVEGTDVDGRSIRIVLTVYETETVIKIVTAMEL